MAFFEILVLSFQISFLKFSSCHIPLCLVGNIVNVSSLSSIRAVSGFSFLFKSTSLAVEISDFSQICKFFLTIHIILLQKFLLM